MAQKVAAKPQGQSYPVPEGFTDWDAFHVWARETYQLDVDADKPNRDAQLEDISFTVGKQWEDADLQSRKGRPCLTINTLPQFVAQVVGDIRINRPSIKVRPAEDSDKEEADVREGLIRQIERQCDAQSVYVDAGQSQCVGGLGNFEITLDYATNEVFDRVIGIKAIPNPLAVVWDRMSVEKTGKDARWVWVVDEMGRKDFEKAYPDAKPTDMETGAASDSWVRRDTVRVVRLAMIKETEVEIALLEGGRVMDVADLESGVIPIRTRKTLRKSCCMYLTNGYKLLEKPVEWPIDRVPVIKVTGWEMWEGTKRHRWGVVRFAKDPVRLRNYWRSTSAEVIALSPLYQWLIHESEKNPNDSFREAAENNDRVLPWSGATKPDRVDPPPVPAALLNEAAMNTQDVKDVTGLHDASLGARSNETSGKAILARQREGDVANNIYSDNLRASIQAGGDVINQLIPVAYDTARTITYLGVDEVPKPVRVNDPEAEKVILFGNSKYDVVVDVGPSYSTKRVEAAETLTSLSQSMPKLGEVAGDLIIQSFDMPMGDEIAERYRKTLPPQIVEDPNNPQPIDPAQQQAQAMQAQQAQQQAQALQAAEGQAKVEKAQADAVKARADARKAEAEAARAELELAAVGFVPPQPPEQFAPAPQQFQPSVQPMQDAAQGFEQGAASPEQLAPGQGFPGA